MKKEILSQFEFEANNVINEFVNRDNLLINITKISNGYELINENHLFKVVEINNRWHLVVVKDGIEYFFDGTNSTYPFNSTRHYDGWNIRFENLLI